MGIIWDLSLENKKKNIIIIKLIFKVVKKCKLKNIYKMYKHYRRS